MKNHLLDIEALYLNLTLFRFTRSLYGWGEAWTSQRFLLWYATFWVFALSALFLFWNSEVTFSGLCAFVFILYFEFQSASSLRIPDEAAGSPLRERNKNLHQFVRYEQFKRDLRKKGIPMETVRSVKQLLQAERNSEVLLFKFDNIVLSGSIALILGALGSKIAEETPVMIVLLSIAGFVAGVTFFVSLPGQFKKARKAELVRFLEWYERDC